MKKITALIPVRAGSKRLPNKNILPFADSNLLIHKIRELKKIDKINKSIIQGEKMSHFSSQWLYRESNFQEY